MIGILGAAASCPAAQTSPAAVPTEDLKPGEFVWLPQVAPEGSLLLIVSLVGQRAYLYRNGVRIAVTTVSTGRPGYETPPGVYTVLQKHEEHYSNLYDDAPMPFMQRLTWSGLALHAGSLPGRPDSHGCIRLPPEFARRLFGISTLGMTVVVMNEQDQTPQTVQLGWLATTAAPWAPPGPPLSGEFWRPEASPRGALTILISLSEQRIVVLRQGIAIGAGFFQLDGPPPAGLQVLQLQDGTLPEASAYIPGAARLRWQRFVPEGRVARQHEEADMGDATAGLYGRLRVSRQFARQVYAELRPGAIVVITDEPITPPTDVQAIMESATEDDAGGAVR